MKSIFFAIILIASMAYFTPAIAQSTAIISTYAAEINMADELAKLKQEKLVIDINLKKQEAVCYKKFAVSDCLKEAKKEAQTALSKVKRRELEIKDLQRNNKAESDLNIKENPVGEKASRNATKNSDNVFNSEPKDKTAKVAKVAKAAKSTKAIKTDAEILAEKSENDKLRADAAKKRLDESNQKLAVSQKKAQSRANKNSQSAANTAAYNQKLIQADAHKAALEKKNLDRKKAKSAPLPLPLQLPDSIPTVKTP
jgi:colicin import membrane protein